ncbi:peptidoglycan DD-metalloendopeptidase family protein [Phocoenobacter skyensis]|uniref:Peptidoglycan DD-metalloendopeptidase family protein n=1 Tax=Phocoenobacter skyensis TaxID=97481 RepID=A0AAJ6P313_9PAST|nr:peptidoglycan DD-metalloendopeptidase family protein [Pasteurella skyensis]MDP8175260.1 peptidoglycan DD-metalloendopeptidase family protein [Pasteurella skyensis]
MKRVILAADRRKKRRQIQWLLFSIAFLFLMIGIVLALQGQNTIAKKRYQEQHLLSSDDIVVSDHFIGLAIEVSDILVSDQESSEESFDELAEESLENSQEDVEQDLSDDSIEESSEDSQEDVAEHLNNVDEDSVEEDLTEEGSAEEGLAEEGSTTEEDSAEDGSIEKSSENLQNDSQIESTATSSNVQHPSDDKTVDLVSKNKPTDTKTETAKVDTKFSYTIKKDDTLVNIFEQHNLDTKVATFLVENYPILEKLKEKQQLNFVIDNTSKLKQMSWILSKKEQHIFRTDEKTQYSHQEVLKKGIWKKEVLQGQIDTNLSVSLAKLGVSIQKTYKLAAGLKPQMSLKTLRQGDEFAILADCEYIDNERVAVGKIDGFRITRGHEKYYAILAANGHYYARGGAVQNKTKFSRYPLRFRPRITSRFNPYRRHPITRRVRPHKGVDFGVKTGTVVIAPADGIVSTVAYQRRGAGKYIKIQHGKKYATVYMHLSRQLVKRGQRVKKGQRIGYSGNTGRSTGPHLHYEFHINGRAVNPMTVKLPGVNTHSVMSLKERKAFLVKAKNVVNKLK